MARLSFLGLIPGSCAVETELWGWLRTLVTPGTRCGGLSPVPACRPLAWYFTAVGRVGGSEEPHSLTLHLGS